MEVIQKFGLSIWLLSPSSIISLWFSISSYLHVTLMVFHNSFLFPYLKDNISIIFFLELIFCDKIFLAPKSRTVLEHSNHIHSFFLITVHNNVERFNVCDC